jgi:integrase
LLRRCRSRPRRQCRARPRPPSPRCQRGELHRL